jgi:hypothetical protein
VYIPSLIMALISTYLSRHSIEAFIIHYKQKDINGH